MGTIEAGKKAGAKPRRRIPRPSLRRPATPGRTSRTVGVVILCVAVGSAVGYVMKDQFGDGPASAETPSGSVGSRSVRPAATTQPAAVEVLAPAVAPEVLRFAWEATCGVVLSGSSDGTGATTVASFESAHEHGQLFEPGIIPTDVKAALDAAYDGIVRGQRGIGTNSELTTEMSNACAAWSMQVAALG